MFFPVYWSPLSSPLRRVFVLSRIGKLTSDTTRLISNHPQSHDLSMHSPIGHLDGLFNHCYISYQFDMWSFLFLPWTLMPKQVPWQKKTEKLAIIIIRPFFVVPVAWTARKFGIQSVGRWRRYEHLLYDDWSWGTRGNLCMFFFGGEASFYKRNL